MFAHAHSKAITNMILWINTIHPAK